MENTLFEAASFGDIDSLIAILEEDKLILAKFVAGCFNWSPLLVAASQGHKDFVEKLLTLKPELAQASDAQSRSVLHLAAAKGHTEIVKLLLLKLGSGICLNRDRDGLFPFHVAAVNGRFQVLEELLRANSVVARARLDHEEMNILHLCIKHHQFETLKILLETIPDNEFVNARDYNGNTILHLAVYEKQVEVIKHVLDNTQVDEIALNLSRKTALDIAFKLGITAKGEEKRELDLIRELLGALGARGIRVGHFDWLQRKDILMLVASVLATTSFQTAVNPPGGVWQDTSDGHRAGESVLAHNYPHVYTYIILTNTLVFLGSVGLMFFLASARNNFFRRRIIVSVLAVFNSTIVCLLAFSYGGSVYAVAPDKGLFNVFSKLNDDNSNSHLEVGTNAAVIAVVLTFLILFLFGISFLVYLQTKVRMRIHRKKHIMARLQTRFSNSSGVFSDNV